MTSRSELSRYVRGLAETVIQSAGPVDASACRDGIVNNVNHLVDVATQMRASISLQASDYYEQASPDATRYQQIDGLPPLRFPTVVRSGGGSAVIVPHLSASVSSAATVTFRLRLSLMGTPSFPPTSPTGIVTVAEVSTTSTTAVGLTPDPIYVPESVIRAARTDPFDPTTALRGISSLDENGSMSVGYALWVQLEVWAISSQGGALPRVHGLSAREYIG